MKNDKVKLNWFKKKQAICTKHNKFLTNTI